MIWMLIHGPHENGFTEPGWYFADEAEYLNGPYETHNEAENASKEYGQWLNSPEN